MIMNPQSELFHSSTCLQVLLDHVPLSLGSAGCLNKFIPVVNGLWMSSRQESGLTIMSEDTLLMKMVGDFAIQNLRGSSQ